MFSVTKETLFPAKIGFDDIMTVPPERVITFNTGESFCSLTEHNNFTIQIMCNDAIIQTVKHITDQTSLLHQCMEVPFCKKIPYVDNKRVNAFTEGLRSLEHRLN